VHILPMFVYELRRRKYKLMITQKDTIKLLSSRLYIVSLTYNQLIKYTRFDGSLEAELGVTSHKRILPEEFREALEQTILPSVKHNPENILFSTLWIIIYKEKNLMVGDLCFKGPPNKEGEIEIGYGTYEGFFNKGFMSEAVGAIQEWAFSQPNVTSILAETGRNNWASHKTLQKNKFVPFKETDNMIWWRLEKQ
jgi:[ribosomal protein S5]-alanine N-acetyltransferase